MGLKKHVSNTSAHPYSKAYSGAEGTNMQLASTPLVLQGLRLSMLLGRTSQFVQQTD